MSLSNSLLIGGLVDVDVLYEMLVLLSSLYPEIEFIRLFETILFTCWERNNLFKNITVYQRSMTHTFWSACFMLHIRIMPWRSFGRRCVGFGIFMTISDSIFATASTGVPNWIFVSVLITLSSIYNNHGLFYVSRQCKYNVNLEGYLFLVSKRSLLSLDRER